MGAGLQPPVILIVDDETDIRDAVAEFLVEEGYQVAHARDGVEAMSFLHQQPLPAVVLLDLMMPRKPGHAVLAEIRADERLRPLPVLVVSAQPKAQIPDTADAVLLKPFQIEELLALVHRLSKRS